MVTTIQLFNDSHHRLVVARRCTEDQTVRKLISDNEQLAVHLLKRADQSTAQQRLCSRLTLQVQEVGKRLRDIQGVGITQPNHLGPPCLHALFVQSQQQDFDHFQIA